MIILILGCASPTYMDRPQRAGPTAVVDDSGIDDSRIDADGDGYYALDEDAALVDCDDGDPAVTPLTERLVPEGWFLRGHPDVVTASGDMLVDIEQPERRDIYVSGYCVDVYEVVNSDFVEFLEAEAEAGRWNETEEGLPLYDFEDDDDTFPERILDLGDSFEIMEGFEDHPVAEVWSHSADAYCEWVGKRVPTEAEWEKAARGDDGREYPWGEGPSGCEDANISEDRDMCIGDTLPVGLYPDSVSPYGAHDMTGNMGEWVADWYNGSFYSEGPDEDPCATEDDAELTKFPGRETLARIARGGSFALGSPFDNTYARFLEPSDATSNGLGFRCVRDL
ncbi:MAG TPA: formylglycine-generating enzyme family protein [Myxococcota bacterium]|nr:formylglycine-generating enzyme family protein [Myxococcota bacterium]